jgi:SAM-dependent methyltransferase
MKETSKAMRRRWVEDAEGVFPWRSIFVGDGIDIGSGDDLLPVDGCRPFDQGDGDANVLDKYFQPETFDYVHGSHVLEHMHDVSDVLKRWCSLLKKGGHIVGEVPSWELYEHKRERSIFNPDHKSTWSMWNKKGGSALPHYHAPDFFSSFSGANGLTMLLCRLVDTDYDYKAGDIDQTVPHGSTVECFIEFVLKKS